MDTDSFYFALSHDTLEEAVKPELLEEFEREKNQWLSWDKWSNREPGLFKLEKEGTMAIALCSKCYFVDNENSGKTKISSKGVSQKQNMPPPKPGSILKQEHNEQTRAQRANLEKVRYGSGWLQGHGHKQRLQDEGRGDVHIRAHKLGLSAYYNKRWVLEDGIHTEPIEFHTPNWTNGNLGHIPNHGTRKKRDLYNLTKKKARSNQRLLGLQSGNFSPRKRR